MEEQLAYDPAPVGLHRGGSRERPEPAVAHRLGRTNGDRTHKREALR